jgi:putative endonuclease
LFYVYILYSTVADQYYVGQSANIEDRFFRHINSGSKSTKFVKDWNLVYSEKYVTRSEAVKRELQIKNKKSRKYIEWLVSSVDFVVSYNILLLVE